VAIIISNKLRAIYNPAFCDSGYLKKAPLKKAAPLTFNHSFTADHYKMQQLKDKLRAKKRCTGLINLFNLIKNFYLVVTQTKTIAMIPAWSMFIER